MTTLTIKPRELVRSHTSVLKNYANRVLAREESLSADEYRDKDVRMGELFAICVSLELTEREIVALLLAGIVAPWSGCDCPACEAHGFH